MKKILLLTFIFIILVISIFAVGLPHSAYFEVYSLKDTTVVYPDSVSFKSWIIGREDEVLTEQSFGCAYYKDKNLASVQVGNFKTPWSLGDELGIDIYSNLGNGQKIIPITNAGAQYFVRNYQGKDGIIVTKEEINNSTRLLFAKVESGKITFSIIIKKGENALLSIYDKNSELIKSVNLTAKDKNYILDTIGLSSGLYFYRLKSSTYDETKKIMIIRTD